MEMTLASLDLAGFRNYASRMSLVVDAPWTGIVGPNGSGKTNLLEALYFLCRLRGFRHESWTRLRTWEGHDGYVRAVVRGQDREVRWSDQTVEMLEDGDRAASRRRWTTTLPIFGYRPDDDLFFHEEPRHRRSYLDWLCSYLDAEYMDAAAAFERVLRQRNAALRDADRRSVEFDVWDHELALLGATLHAAREAALARLRPRYLELWRELERDPADLAYRPGGCGDAEALRARLTESRERDRQRGWTGVGPHRDDLLVLRHDRPLRESGSQGYRKLAVILLAAACATLLPAADARRQLFYLDDIEGELDDDNEARLFSLLQRLPLQILLTAVRKPPVLAAVVGATETSWVELV